MQGLFADEAAAARAYDAALVRLKGATAATNFSLSAYVTELAQHHQIKMVCSCLLGLCVCLRKHMHACMCVCTCVCLGPDKSSSL